MSREPRARGRPKVDSIFNRIFLKMFLKQFLKMFLIGGDILNRNISALKMHHSSILKGEVEGGVQQIRFFLNGGDLEENGHFL